MSKRKLFAKKKTETVNERMNTTDVLTHDLIRVALFKCYAICESMSTLIENSEFVDSSLADAAIDYIRESLAILDEYEKAV